MTLRLRSTSLKVVLSPLLQIGTCEVKNGFPKPNITWYRNNTPLRTAQDGERINICSALLQHLSLCLMGFNVFTVLCLVSSSGESSAQHHEWIQRPVLSEEWTEHEGGEGGQRWCVLLRGHLLCSWRNQDDRDQPCQHHRVLWVLHIVWLELETTTGPHCDPITRAWPTVGFLFHPRGVGWSWG